MQRKKEGFVFYTFLCMFTAVHCRKKWSGPGGFLIGRKVVLGFSDR